MLQLVLHQLQHMILQQEDIQLAMVCSCLAVMNNRAKSSAR